MIRLLRRCHLPLLLCLSFSGPLSLALCRFAPEAAASLVRFPLLLVPMLPLLIILPGRARLAAFGACSALLFAAGHIALPHRAALYAMPALCSVLLFYALAQADQTPAQAAPVFYFSCAAAQLAALFLLHHADAPVRHMPEPQIAFCAWLLLFLLAFNRISLNSSTLARYPLSESMARMGALLTTIVFLLALLLCATPAVVCGITRLFILLRDGSISLLLWLINLFPMQSTGGSIAGGPMMAPEFVVPVQEDPSWFAVLLERIAAILSLAVLAVGAVLLVWLLGKALVRLVLRLLVHLQRHSAAVAGDYEDEITDTRSEEGERALRIHRRERLSASYPDTPAGRIRRRYARLRARHPAWPDSATARENLPSGTASLYERARYSQHAPTGDDAQRFEQETR